jgi:Uma2 family endonuclease
MSVATQVITAEELFRMPQDGFRYELVKGELKRMAPAGGEHGTITYDLGFLLGQHVKANNLGVLFTAETGFKIETDPDTVLAPDIAFVRRERIPKEGIPKGYWPGPPDLAVEIISPNDTYEEVEEKVAQWLSAGTAAVWVINPRRRTVTVYRSLTDITVLTETDELTGGDVVPGFRCPVAKIFGL